MFEKNKTVSKKDFVWAFMYQPDVLDDLILLERLKPKFEKFTETKMLPDTLLYGPPGVGKSATCDVLIKCIDFDVLYLNGSTCGIDNIRGDVKTFSTRTSSKPKLVYIEEFDSPRLNAVYEALRAEMELAKKVSFLFNCNHVEKIPEPIRSRCGGGISFFYNNEEKKELQKKYFKRCCKILDLENVTYEPKAIAKIVQHKFPDMRNTIHEMQSIFDQFGEIKLATVESSLNVDLGSFFEMIKGRNFGNIRTYCASLSSDYDSFYGTIVKKVENYVEESDIPELIDLCYEHSKTSGASVDKQLVLIHFCVNLMNLGIK